MVSRIDRLFILLDTGSSDTVRLAAAKQLGEVQRIQPNEFNYLLCRIKEYSSKSLWETRVAAGHATRCVLEQVEPWPSGRQVLDEYQNPTHKKTSLDVNDDKKNLTHQLLEQNVNIEQIIQEFDLDKIISECPKLLSLDLTKDADDLELATTSPKNSSTTSSRATSGRGSSRGGRRESRMGSLKSEQLSRQRKILNKELGTMDSLNIGVKSTDIVSNDDLLQTDYEVASSTNTFPQSSASKTNKLNIQTVNTLSFITNYDNIIKLLTQNNCICTEASYQEELNDQILSKSKKWPLEDITRQYTSDLFDPAWEIRHGAAIALREIVKLQGSYAGKRLELDEESNQILNQLWLVDMALKSICVLALDKFGDFLFDQVVAPVRENAAQLLGCCIAKMTESNACSTIKQTFKMLSNPNWETRHGGVLGLKYSLNVVDETLARRILQESFDPIFKCLGDPVDDVSAEAAAALVPVKDLMIETIPDKSPKLIKFLWNHLADLDELTTSTSNIVLLLASLITSSSAHLEPIELEKSLPRLWSLLNHSSTSVRISVLRALKTLLSAQKSTCLTWLPEQLLTTLLRLLFQRAILENMEEVRPYIESTWLQLILIDTGEYSSSNRFQLLKSTSQYLNFWLCLVMQPSNTPIDRGSPMWLNIGPDGTKSDSKQDGEVYIASYTFNAEVASQQKSQITKARFLGTKLLGSLYANLINDFSTEDSPESQHAKQTMNYLAEMFVHYLKIKSANQRIISGWTLESWANHQSDLIVSDNKPEIMKTILPKNLVDQLNVAIQEVSLGYDELASTFTRLQQETRDFVNCLRDAGISPNLPFQTDKRVIYNLNQIQILCDLNLELEVTRLVAKRPQNISKNHYFSDITKSKMYTMLMEKKSNLNKSLKNTSQSQKNLSTSVLGSLACAHISWHLFPQKIESLTDPLIDSIEIEEEQSLQDKLVNCIITLFNTLCQNLEKNKDLLDKLLDRLVNILSCQALSMIANESNGTPTSLPTSPRCSIDSGKGFDLYKIVLLDNLQRKAELFRSTSRRQSSVTSASGLKRSHSLTSSTEIQDQEQEQEQNSRLVTDVPEVKVRGASCAIGNLVTHFGIKLPQKLPTLWQMITTDIKAQVESHRKSSTIDEVKLVKSLKLLEVVGDKLDVNLRKHLMELYEDLVHLLTVPNPWTRHHGAHCVGLISKLMFADTVATINKRIIPMLELHDHTLARCGAIEAIAMIIEHLQLDLVPKINMFIIHVLRRMSDQNDQVRLTATHCFGKLLSLMPLNLEKNKNDCSLNGQTNTTVERESILKPEGEIEEKSFIEQLLDTKKLENYTLPFELKAELRPYQQDGLNWLTFLNRFNLHGILCDEMGLGKTLMTISMLVSDHINLSKSQKVSDDESSIKPITCQPSLIVCPSTLTEHWLYEVEKFLPFETRAFMNPVAYCGTMGERVNIRCQILNSCNVNNSKENLIAKSAQNQPPVNLMVTSYDMVRNDIEFFKEVNWNYCVLDEGHIIKNGKTKLSRSIRLLNAKHRLILSGTPIQNNVTELWSLFDFLMPGFLGSDRQFNSKYAKPILQSRELKCSARDLEAGALAMESLHRQVLPFILRRVKEDVLDDLPPKIIQDYYCELSPLQHKLYEDFTRSKLCNEVTKRSIHNLATTATKEVEESEIESTTNSKSHVFQALQYLKNVCNHPKLVLTAKHSQYATIKKSLDNEKSSLDDIAHSSKLKALKQLLIDCGIGVQPVEEQQQQQQQQALSVQSVVNQHRALIFCQVRSMVEIIENDLLKRHLPSVTYLKLDGSVAPNQRHSIVSRFNNDPSIDILLLTTQIGGLGLNLTGADTVIFVEHDWNPTKDLQAMDRAHRIGQKKVVNVYRLITKATLEEKIMGLQKFKTMVSNTVINQDNTGLGSMNVDQLFDLFEDSGNNEKSPTGRAQSQKAGGSSSSSFMDLLPELWDQQQYETEYDLSSFVSSLKQ